METFYIDSNGYSKRQTLWPTNETEDEVMMVWEHCTECFDNPHQIADSKRNRALLTSILKMHNLEAYFTGATK